MRIGWTEFWIFVIVCIVGLWAGCSSLYDAM